MKCSLVLLLLSGPVLAVDTPTTPELIVQLNDAEPAVRQAAAEKLGRQCRKGDEEAHTALEKALADTEPSVKRAVVLAMGLINAPGAADAIAAAYKFDDGTHPDLTAAYGTALESCGKKGVDALLSLARSGDDADRDRAVSAFLATRTRPAAEAVPDLLSDPHLTPDQRVALVNSLASYRLDPPLSADLLLDFIVSRPKELSKVQAAAITTLGKMSGLKGAKAINYLTGLLDSEIEETRTAAIAAIESARLSEAAPRLLQAFADNKRPAGERIGMIKAMRALKDREAIPVLKAAFDSSEPSELRMEALKTLATLDPAAAAPVAARLLDQSEAALKKEAMQALAKSAAGAAILGQRFIDKKLDTKLLPEVIQALQNHAKMDEECARLLKLLSESEKK